MMFVPKIEIAESPDDGRTKFPGSNCGTECPVLLSANRINSKSHWPVVLNSQGGEAALNKLLRTDEEARTEFIRELNNGSNRVFSDRALLAKVVDALPSLTEIKELNAVDLLVQQFNLRKISFDDQDVVANSLLSASDRILLSAEGDDRQLLVEGCLSWFLTKDCFGPEEHMNARKWIELIGKHMNPFSPIPVLDELTDRAIIKRHLCGYDHLLCLLENQLATLRVPQPLRTDIEGYFRQIESKDQKPQELQIHRVSVGRALFSGVVSAGATGAVGLNPLVGAVLGCCCSVGMQLFAGTAKAESPQFLSAEAPREYARNELAARIASLLAHPEVVTNNRSHSNSDSILL